VEDWKGPYRYLFVENNELYDEFTSQFGVCGVRGGYWESGMDTYLDDYSPDVVFEKLNKAINSGYDEDTPVPICHIYQQTWQGNAYILANRTALIELREAIDIALKHGEARLGVSRSDDEGDDLFIACLDEDFDWDTLELPYHDRECYDPDETVDLPPYKVFEKYKRFFK
jgi:hypothetical protein